MPYRTRKLITFTCKAVGQGSERLGDPLGELMNVQRAGVDQQISVTAEFCQHLAFRRPSTVAPAHKRMGSAGRLLAADGPLVGGVEGTTPAGA
jgi:hypothetical protein